MTATLSLSWIDIRLKVIDLMTKLTDTWVPLFCLSCHCHVASPLLLRMLIKLWFYSALWYHHALVSVKREEVALENTTLLKKEKYPGLPNSGTSASPRALHNCR